jgi:hypothetical protein
MRITVLLNRAAVGCIPASNGDGRFGSHPLNVTGIANIMVRTMNTENPELSIEQLGTVTGSGIVDTVASDAEASTNAFLKNFAEASLRFSAFINAPAGSQAPTANQE